MPKLALAPVVPAIDWNSRSTGAPARIASSCVVMWASTQVWVGTPRRSTTILQHVLQRRDGRRRTR